MKQQQDDITTHNSPASAGVLNAPLRRGRGPGPVLTDVMEQRPVMRKAGKERKAGAVLPAGAARKARPVGSVREAVVPMEGHAWATAAEYSETRGAGGEGEAWADIRAAVAGAREFGDALLLLGRSAADKQARALLRRVGKRPSESSVDEAGADAVAAVVEAFHRRRWWSVVSGTGWARVWARRGTSESRIDRRARVVRGSIRERITLRPDGDKPLPMLPERRRGPAQAIWTRAHRGAWSSLRSWSMSGGKGRGNGEAVQHVSWSGWLVEALGEVDQAIASGSQTVGEVGGGDAQLTRARAARWAWRALLSGPWPAQAAARARAMASARQCARVVSLAILRGGGVDLALVELDISRDAWRKMVQRLQPWARLRAARAVPPAVVRARADMREAALDWREAARECARLGAVGVMAARGVAGVAVGQGRAWQSVPMAARRRGMGAGAEIASVWRADGLHVIRLGRDVVGAARRVVIGPATLEAARAAVDAREAARARAIASRDAARRAARAWQAAFTGLVDRIHTGLFPSEGGAL